MRILLLLFCIVTFTVAVTAQAKVAISDLSFLAGCWEMNDVTRKRVVSEQWMAPSGNAMLGMSRTVRDGKLTAYEFLRLVDDGAKIDYISRPNQNKEDTSFKLIKSSSNEAVFENLLHDFPQRIIYRLTKEGSLAARIEGTMNGQTRGVDFPYQRVKCP